MNTRKKGNKKLTSGRSMGDPHTRAVVHEEEEGVEYKKKGETKAKKKTYQWQKHGRQPQKSCSARGGGERGPRSTPFAHPLTSGHRTCSAPPEFVEIFFWKKKFGGREGRREIR
jgi:hypothetical protein